MKQKISVTLDDELLKMVDSKRARFGMKRSGYINFKLNKIFKKRTI